MEIVDSQAQAYAEHYSSKLGSLLQEIAGYTAEHHPEAHMLSGPLQGKFLEMLSFLLRPRRVLEIGTGTGYNAALLAHLAGAPPLLAVASRLDARLVPRRQLCHPDWRAGLLVRKHVFVRGAY